MWAADQGHAAAVKLLIDRGADLSARSNPAPRDRSPARLGKATDPRKQNRALQAVAAGATREEVARLAVRERSGTFRPEISRPGSSRSRTMAAG